MTDTQTDAEATKVETRVSAVRKILRGTSDIMKRQKLLKWLWHREHESKIDRREADG